MLPLVSRASTNCDYTAAHDKRDRQLLVGKRGMGAATESNLEHVPGSSEPLPWVPNQMLGAYGEATAKDISRCV